MRGHLARAFAAAILFVTLRAEANGRFPASQEVIVGPGPGASTIALRTTFGFALSDDRGATFHWLCEEALGYPSGSPFDPPFALGADGTLEVGVLDGITTVAPDRCSLGRASAVEGQWIGDLDTDATGQIVALVTSSGATCALNRVYRSTDGGRSFVPMGTGVANVLFDTLEMARTDPMRVYLTGTTLTPPPDAGCADAGGTLPGQQVLFFRSDDGGATLTSFALPSDVALGNAYIAAIDPTNRDTVYVRSTMLVTDSGTTEQEGVLLKSTDGGASWVRIAQTFAPMTGFAIGDDARTLWIGSYALQDGLQRSDDTGASWHRIGDQHVLGLRQHQGVLYLCANFVLDGFGLGRSTDSGQSFEPVLQFADLMGPPACFASPGASMDMMACVSRWPVQHQVFVPSAMDGGADAGDAGTDAAALPPRIRARGGCGCDVVPPGRCSIAAVVIVALCGLARVRRRSAGTTRRKAPRRRRPLHV